MLLRNIIAETSKLTALAEKAADNVKGELSAKITILIGKLQTVIAKLTSATQKGDKINCIDRVIQLGINLKNQANDTEQRSADNAGANNGGNSGTKQR